MMLDNRPGGLPDITTYPAGGLKIRLHSANGVPFPDSMQASSVQLSGFSRAPYPEKPTTTAANGGLDVVIFYSHDKMVTLAAHGFFFVEYAATIDGDYEPFETQKIIFSTNPAEVYTSLDTINVNVNGAELVYIVTPPGSGALPVFNTYNDLINYQVNMLPGQFVVVMVLADETDPDPITTAGRRNQYTISRTTADKNGTI